MALVELAEYLVEVIEIIVIEVGAFPVLLLFEHLLIVLQTSLVLFRGLDLIENVVAVVIET